MATTVLDHLDTLAVVAGGLFAGTALYISIGQVPALRQFGLNEHWNFFPHMFKHAIIAPVSTIVAGAAGIAHGTRIGGSSFDRNLWLAAGSTFLAMVPYTIVCLGPINKKIIDDNKKEISTATKKELLDQWVMFHSFRTVGSIAGFAAMAYGLSRHSSLLLRS